MRHLRARAAHLVDIWIGVVREARSETSTRSYSRFDRDKKAGPPILALPLEPQEDRSAAERELVAPTSMRDVEPSVHLWLERRRALGSH